MDGRLDAAVAEIAAHSHGLVCRVHLDLLGASHEAVAHRVASGRWIPLFDSVYRVAGAPRSWESDVLAACWAGGTRGCASHRTAAALHDLRVDDET
jgi:hypothetical protein